MEVKFYFVGSGCYVLEIDKNIKIACDPALNLAGTDYNFKLFTSKRIKEPIYDNMLFNDIDLWLFTHEHADHIDNLGLSKVKVNSNIVIQKSVKEFFTSKDFKQISILNWGEKKKIKINNYKVEITAIPAFHGNNFIMRKLVGKVNGYYIKVFKGKNVKSIYITSDTVYHKKIIKKLNGKEIDIMVANLGEVRADKFGGPLTMSVTMLSKMTESLNPKVIIPIHYDDFSHFDTKETDLVNNGFKIVKRGNWVDLNNYSYY